jgi:NhaA family Na+:H+ antiporter
MSKAPIIKRLPALKLTTAFKQFYENKSSVGILLIICTAISLSIANSPLQHMYHHILEADLSVKFWKIDLPFSLEMWVNDGLMAIFFFLVGLEIKRELIFGELSSFRKASLPISAAIGGMLVPAVIYSMFNFGTDTASGWGIPMATDIAFAIGILSLVGNKVPVSLKVFLTALAVVDDLGAILVIAVFYTDNLSFNFLMAGFAVFALMLILNKLNNNNMAIYIILSLILWYFIYQSGIHATIAGVLAALAIPFRKQLKNSMLHKIEHALVNPVNFGIIPLFALVNTAIPIEGDFLVTLQTLTFSGIAFGLIIGKPIGILGFAILSVRAGISSLPVDVKGRHLLGAGFLGGIGFTMSIFISMLAFSDVQFINIAKISVLIASLIAGIIGFFVLKTAKK